MDAEAEAVENKNKAKKMRKLQNWDKIIVNQDPHGKILMEGNQTMTAVALGMIAQD